MSVKIRLSLIGKKHVPFFRIVAVDSRKKRDGKFLAIMGTYNALKGEIVEFNEACYNEWLAKGALPSDSAKKIFKQYKRDASKEDTSQKKIINKKASEQTMSKEEGTADKKKLSEKKDKSATDVSSTVKSEVKE